MIDSDFYQKILEVMSILCVDVIIKNRSGQYLLIRRANEPLKDEWWVVGGRVLKGESLEEAAIRKVREEISVEVHDMQPIGYYEAVYEKSAFRVKSEYHTVSIVFVSNIRGDEDIMLDGQSTEWKYASQLPSGFCIKCFADRSQV
jgi:colanic acid biosynthesis protein WcaH